MQNIKWEIIIPIITLVIAVTSPVISNIINTKHQEKMFMLKFFTEHRLEIIESYITRVGEYIESESYNKSWAFGPEYNKLFLYIPKKLWKTVYEINNSIKDGNFENAKINFENFCVSVAQEFPRLKY